MNKMDWHCDNCGGDGEIDYPADKLEQSFYVICSNCSTPSAYAWCEKCGMGGQIVEAKFEQFPATWKCTGCNSEYEFPPGFYETITHFQPVKFDDLEKEEASIRAYQHVPIVGLRKFLQFWDEY